MPSEQGLRRGLEPSVKRGQQEGRFLRVPHRVSRYPQLPSHAGPPEAAATFGDERLLSRLQAPRLLGAAPCGWQDPLTESPRTQSPSSVTLPWRQCSPPLALSSCTMKEQAGIVGDLARGWRPEPQPSGAGAAHPPSSETGLGAERRSRLHRRQEVPAVGGLGCLQRTSAVDIDG